MWINYRDSHIVEQMQENKIPQRPSVWITQNSIICVWGLHLISQERIPLVIELDLWLNWEEILSPVINKGYKFR